MEDSLKHCNVGLQMLWHRLHELKNMQNDTIKGLKCAFSHKSIHFKQSASLNQTSWSTLSASVVWIISAFQHFVNFLTVRSFIYLILQTHSCLLGNVPQPKRPGIKPDLKTVEQPFFIITYLLLLLSRLFTTSTHAQLLLTLVLSECVLRVFVCRVLSYFPLFCIVFWHLLFEMSHSFVLFCFFCP